MKTAKSFSGLTCCVGMYFALLCVTPVHGDGCVSWEDRTPPPGTRIGHGLAYDEARGVTVLTGGLGGNGLYPHETWEWNGTAWALLSVGGPDANYFGHPVAYDRGRGVLVAFGGGQYGTDTWEWNGSSWTRAGTTGPSSRMYSAMAYDHQRGVTVLFGGSGVDGNGNYGQLGDTWEWDGMTWTLRSTTGPAPRSEHALAYDRARGVVVLFGGQSGDGLTSSSFGDTWEWNGTSWTQRSTTGPSLRYDHAMAYDSARNVTMLFGGSWWDGSDPYRPTHYADTWEWDGTDWTLRSTSAQVPVRRGNHAMAYDVARGVTVLFGGWWDDYTAQGDTWEWNGVDWIPRTSTGPFARDSHAMAFDSARGMTVLFGGITNDRSYFSDTWEWNGAAWTARDVTGPSARSAHAMAYDAGRGVTVLFGGLSDVLVYDPGGDLPLFHSDTWEWDGTAWSLRDTVGPAPRAFHAMAYDAARGVTVLYGGWAWDGSDYVFYNDTWEWDGVTWTRVADGPAFWIDLAMAYDSGVGAVLLSSGWNLMAWDGAEWTLQNQQGPAPSFTGALAYDSARDVVVKFGATSELIGETWERRGTWWQRSLRGPGGRRNHAMAYDSTRGVTVLFGGSLYGSIGSTWEYGCSTNCAAAAPEAPAAEAHSSCNGCYATKNRYLSFKIPAPPPTGETTALRVTMSAMPGPANCPRMPDFSAFDDAEMWVGYEAYQGYLLYSGVFRLQSTPYFRDWTTAVPGGVIQVADCNIVPCATYTVQAVSNAACDLFDPAAYTAPLVLTTTSVWGDVVGANNLALPNGIVDFVDISASVDRFKNAPGTQSRTWFDIAPNNPMQGVNFDIDFNDISTVVDAFKGLDYPFSGPTAPAVCP